MSMKNSNDTIATLQTKTSIFFVIAFSKTVMRQVLPHSYSLLFRVSSAFTILPDDFKINP